MVEALEPFAIYDASPVEERAHELAVAFDLPYVVREERDRGGLGGMTTSAAAAGGHPGRDRRGRRARPARGAGDVAARRRACANALRQLGMLPGDAGSAAARTSGRSAASSGCARRTAGWWELDGRGGRRGGRAASCSARIRDLWGDVLEEIVAPQDGVVLFITSSPAVGRRRAAARARRGPVRGLTLSARRGGQPAAWNRSNRSASNSRSGCHSRRRGTTMDAPCASLRTASIGPSSSSRRRG